MGFGLFLPCVLRSAHSRPAICDCHTPMIAHSPGQTSVTSSARGFKSTSALQDISRQQGCDILDAKASDPLWCCNRPQEDNPYLLLEEGADNPSTEMHTELGLVHSDSQADLEAGRGNESPVSIDRNFSIGDLDDEDDVNAKPAPTPPSPRRQNKSLMPNRQGSGQVENGDSSSQSSSTKHTRPVPPPKPSGKKD